jgi:hypothetical protein
MEEVEGEEFIFVLQSFQKDRSLGPNGLPVEFFLGCFDFIEEDSRRVIEESRTIGKILEVYNTTFIALIPKIDNPSSFDNFKPISLCNCIYKIILKIIARRLKVIFSRQISSEQFGLLEGREIHELVRVAQALHSIKVKRLKAMVVKVDLSKTYDRARWLYLRLMLIHLGFKSQFVTWVMNCVTLIPTLFL